LTWTYLTPPNALRDEVRLLTGDTDTTDPQLQDEEIAILTAEGTNPYNVAIKACIAIAAKYTRQADKTAGKLSISASVRAKSYRDQAMELRKLRNSRGLRITAGGQSFSEKQTAVMNTDALQPSFSRGQHDYPGNYDMSSWRYLGATGFLGWPF
jgi:hypothetical protein